MFKSTAGIATKPHGVLTQHKVNESFLNGKLQDLTVINCPSRIKSSLESALGCMILID